MKQLREPAVRSASWIVVAALTLAGCAHTPSSDRPLKGASEEPVGVAIPAPTAAGASATNPEPIVPPAAQAPEIVDDTAAPTAVAGITPAQYSDLFDRMRAGFKLEDSDRHAVDVQADWYANHPDYLERAFGRAELYMYHIVP